MNEKRNEELEMCKSNTQTELEEDETKQRKITHSTQHNVNKNVACYRLTFIYENWTNIFSPKNAYYF